MSKLSDLLDQLGPETKSSQDDATNQPTEQDACIFASVDRILANLNQQHFSGTVTLEFEAGHIVRLRRTESINRGAEDEWQSR